MSRRALFTPYRFITRIDQPAKHTHAWLVRPPGRKPQTFSDLKHGGPDASHAKALEYVLAPIRQVIRNELQEVALLASTGHPVRLEQHEEAILGLFLSGAGLLVKPRMGLAR